jgi:hypothetical protein
MSDHEFDGIPYYVVLVKVDETKVGKKYLIAAGNRKEALMRFLDEWSDVQFTTISVFTAEFTGILH